MASRVLPAPPGPVRLSTCTFSLRKSSAALATSASRPISEVRGAGSSISFAASLAAPEILRSVAFGASCVTSAANRYPLRGTVRSNRWSRSSKARRSSSVHCTTESSVTKLSGQTACISSCFPIRWPGFLTKYASISYTLGRSLISSPARRTQPLVASSVNWANWYVEGIVFKGYGAPAKVKLPDCFGVSSAIFRYAAHSCLLHFEARREPPAGLRGRHSGSERLNQPTNRRHRK